VLFRSLIPTSDRLWVWIGTLILLTLFVLAVGYSITGGWLGVLIDNRRKISLSRFQTVLWSVLILSALLAAALTNIHLVHNPTDALNISIPPELLAILGIGVTSLVGKSVILNAVKDPEQVDTNPVITDKDSPDRPSWFDMFKGDDKANANYVDLSKVQMFYFTLILVLVYGVALASMFTVVDQKHPAISAFPALTPTIVGLLGISQGGYLVYKALPHDSSNANSTTVATPLTTSNQAPTGGATQPAP
jgi:hypothetical protein